ncbi:MAG: PBP1A family penicillin-binding protein [Clostridia bacterium]
MDKKNNKNSYDKIVKKKKTKSNEDYDKVSKSKNKNKKGKGKKNVAFNIFKIFLIACIAICIIGVGIVAGVLTGIIDETEALDMDDFETTKLSTFFYDINGNQMATIYDENRVVVKYSDLPKHMVDALVSLEDERFFTHNGIDIKRTGAAVFSYVLNGGNSSVGGGSTITQQLVKNISGDNEKDWTRKIREWYRAIMLESKLSKEQILETYLNTIYMGDGAYGIEVAAQNYFAKPVKDVNIAEAACLAAIIQTPEGYNPYKGEKARGKLLDRQKIALSQMKKLGKIDEEQYNQALAYKLEFKKSSNMQTKVNSYFLDEVIESAAREIQAKQNCSYAMAKKKIYGSGYKIYTTMDPAVQQVIDDVYADKSIFYVSRKYGVMMQSSLVIYDYHTGNVVGMAGGATGTKTGDFQLNRATQLPRQPGSSIKPLAAYGPAFEKGTLTPSRTIVDEKININGWSPKNWYGYFYGKVTVRKAVEQSMNIPAVKAVQSVGIDYSYKFLKNFGFKSIVPEDKYYPSLALGGLTHGVTTYEMAAAYGAIANGGIYMKPKVFTKIVDRNGKEVLNVNSDCKQVMKEETAYQLTDVLQSVVKNGSGMGARLGKMPTCGKTGTTDNDQDRWFCGYTPYYSAACWIGFDDQGRPIDRSSYPNIILWKNVMSRIHKGLPIKEFASPTGLFKTNICKESGMLPTEACTAAGSVVSDMFASSTAPTETCTKHRFVEVCSETNKLPSKYCTSLKKIVVTDETDIKESCTLHMTPPAPVIPVDPVEPAKPEKPDKPEKPVKPDEEDETKPEQP